MSFLVIDNGIGLWHTQGISKTTNEDVYYYISVTEAFPKLHDHIHGYGFPFKKVYDYMSLLRSGDISCVMVTDIGFGSLVDFLQMNKIPVFGSNSRGEKLESQRLYAKKICEKLDIATSKYIVIKGVDKLLDFCSKNRNNEFFIKVDNKYRGNFETFHFNSYENLQLYLEAAQFGPLDDEIKFIVEEPLEGEEIGADFFFNGNEVIRPYFCTIEKSTITVGKWVETSVFDDFLEKISLYLSKINYTGPFSIEGFWDGETFYALDFTMRPPYPGSSIFIYAIKNYADFIYGIASGEDIEPIIEDEYWVCLPVYAYDSKNWFEVQFESLDVIKYSAFRNSIYYKERYYFVPGNDDLILAVNTSSDSGWLDAFSYAVDLARKVQSGYIDISDFIDIEKIDRLMSIF